MGKSRLAIEVCRQEQGNYPDGAWIVELASMSDEAMLTSAVASALGVREESGVWLPTVLVKSLRPLMVLMVLNNCEHMIDACASLVDSLLRGAPDLRILATSREPLTIAGEHVWQIPPLQLDAAVQLFAERGEAAGAARGLSGRAREAVAVLCERLDRMPLAIELASARLPALSVEQILDRLDDRFRLLTRGARTSLARHQTLQATIEWSSQLLANEERLLFNRLAYFPGTFTLAAAEAVGVGEGVSGDQVLDVLSRLVQKSLVVGEPDRTSFRYRQLQAIREYGLARLRESGEEASVGRLHALYYLDVAEGTEAELIGPAPDAAVRGLEQEHSNFEAALRWALLGEQRAIGLRFLSVLWRSWDRRGRLSLGRSWLHRFLDPGNTGSADPLLARVSLGAVVLALRQGDMAGADELSERWLPMVRELGDDQQLALWLVELGHVSLRSRKLRVARERFEEGLLLSRRLGNQRLVSACIQGLGATAVTEGNVTQGRPLLEEALQMQGDLGDEGEIAGSLLGLGHSWLWVDEPVRSRPYFDECLTIWRKLGVSRGVGEALYGLGFTELALGDLPRAGQYFRECLAISRDLGNTMTVAECLDGLAMMSALRGEHALAWRAAGSADRLRESAGMTYDDPMQTARDNRLEAATVALGESGRVAAWRAGRAAAVEDVITAVISERGVEEAGTEQLSRREREVALLVAEGLTNRQIGQRLFIAERTAETHVEHILNKLGFHTRAQIAAWVIETRSSDRP